MYIGVGYLPKCSWMKKRLFDLMRVVVLTRTANGLWTFIEKYPLGPGKKYLVGNRPPTKFYPLNKNMKSGLWNSAWIFRYWKKCIISLSVLRWGVLQWFIQKQELFLIFSAWWQVMFTFLSFFLKLF